MEFRDLGVTGLRVSALGLGASPLGSVFRDIDEKEGIKTVHTAIDLGINYIDVAPFYGDTKAESVLGKALSEIPRDKYYLATKVGRYGESKFNFSAKRVKKSVDESLQRLNVDTIDVIQCHDIEFGSLDKIADETIPALREVCEAGKARFVGITGLPLNSFRYVLNKTKVDTILSYCHYSLNDTSLTSLLPMLQNKKVGIINASPLSMGLLTNRGAPDWHPASQEIREICGQAVEYCKHQGEDIAKLALQFSVMNKEVNTTLIGTANPENIKKNVQWIAEPIDIELLETVLSILEPIRDQTWSSGKPENN